jgi:molybdopterin-guanine dinucleotide biosynthesis protein A
MSQALVGIFVGGRGSRMGGVAKGLLQGEGGEPLAARLCRVVRQALPEAEIVLVGRADAYASFGLRALADQPSGLGPIGGLCALLREAAERGAPFAIALACDMPRVSKSLISRLAREPGGSLAPRQGNGWQPLCARYAPEPALRAAEAVLSEGRRSLQEVLARLGPELGELRLSPAEADELSDWDEPADLVQKT